MRRLKAFGALAALLALLVGVPAALAGTIGNPTAALPDLRAGDVTDPVLIGLLASIAWVAWAQFAFATVIELASALRSTPMPRRIPGVLAGQQQLARSLVTAVFLLGPVAASATITGHPFPALPAPAAPVSISTTLTATPAAAPDAAPAAAGQNAQATAGATAGEGAAATTVYTIPSGPGPATLWDIAQTHLGAGERWREIWQLNQGRAQPGGTTMTSPRRLLPGWTVLVPKTTSTTAGAPAGGPTTRQAAADHNQAPPAAPAAAAGIEVTVQAGDTLSELAAEHGHRDWRPAWQANAGRPEPDGARYTNPDLIRPGWRLTLPTAAAASPAPAPAPAPTPAPGPAPDGGDAAPASAPEAAPPATLPAPQAAAPGGPGLPFPPTTPPALAQGPAGAAPAAPGSAAAGVPGAARDAPRSPGPSAPAPSDPAGRREPAGDGSVLTQRPLQVLAFTGGGVLLAACTLQALRRLRRRRFRDRTLGQTISSTPAELAPTEKALLSRAAAGAADVDWLNTALGSLAQSVAEQAGGALPDVVAVRLTGQSLELVLTAARHDPPAPWRVDDSGLRWSVARDDPLPLDAQAARHRSAPYPTLATVGYTAAGEHWLVDLERVGAMSLTGDPDRCLDLARFLAAELAHNSWSEQLLVTLVGFGAELSGLNPCRILHRSSLSQAARDAHATLRETAQVLQAGDTDVLQGRLDADLAGDGWSPHVLLVAPGAQPDPDADNNELLGLLDAIRAQRSRIAVALVLTADTQHQRSTRWQLHVDASGLLTIPALDVQLVAQQLPAEEAADLAALLQLAADSPDVAVPPAAGDQPWEEFADAAGAPLPAFTGARDNDTPAPVDQGGGSGAGGDDRSSVLPLAPSAYLPITATTTEDVVALAPTVSPEVRRHVQDADPTLDEDLRRWHDPHSGIAKLTLLGPVRVSDAAGTPTNTKRDRVTEVVAYLACRPLGVTTEQWITQMWPTEEQVARTRPRAYANTARQWLGKDPRTGQDYLPRANDGPGKVGIYRLRGVLVDAELFRRLRLRGVARGAGGIADLQAALDLVTGEPLSRLRAGGGQWLVDTPVHHHYTSMIVDVAHLVATHHLAAGAPDLAAAAAQVSLLAGSGDDIALLDLVAAKDAAGCHAEAEQYVARILGNHDAEVEEDLPPRTYQVLRRRRWLPQQDTRAS